MNKTSQKYLPISFGILHFFLIFFFRYGVSQSLQEQEQSVLLKLKQYWGNLPYMSQWTPSSSTSSFHCSWPGINCTSNSVTGLSLVDINITRPVPPFICDLMNLTVINLGDNYIPGDFPRALYSCSKLEELDLSENYLVGPLPNDIDQMAKLRSLNLGGNNFTGDIPAAIGRLQELRILLLGGNLFNGSLPPEIGSLSNLEQLWLANNVHLKQSSLPSNYTELKKLKLFWVFNSNLIGEIPDSIVDMTALENLDLSKNNLSGKIPAGLFTLKNLSRVILYKNRLSGEIPQVVEALNLTVIDLSENNLTGRIPEDFGKLNQLTGLALFINQLSGSIPEGIGRLPALQDFKLFTNNLSGDLPQDMGKYSKLRLFEVSSNRLTGQLPENLCSGGKLIGLVAFDNNFSGELPKSLGDCSSFTTVNVRNNRLFGNIPSGLFTSLNLTFLMLNDNSFTGELPEKVAWNLTRLEISNNRFSGMIPARLSSWRRLVVFNASNNLLTGIIPQELTALPYLTNLLLDRNQLTGNLPLDIESWKSLNTLNLSRNQITGQVPGKLGLLPVLTNLDLSDNQFSGQIPSQLGSLRLNFLNLSSNDLTGTIPREFENAAYASSFLNNPGLCATANMLELKICNRKTQKGDKISTPYIVLIVTLSAAVVLLGVSFSLFIIKGRWRNQIRDSKWKFTSFQRLNFTESKIVSGLNDRNLIGSGGSGKVYCVQVNRIGDKVAVKKISNSRNLEHKLEQEFLAEVKILSSILHTNIVKLLCCISSESSKLLVYEYLENGSLDRWLHSKYRQTTLSIPSSVHHSVLDWPKRMQIAVGAAQGLSYMHHDCVSPVVHRDIKSSNILLDSEFNPKIADFGLAKLLNKEGELATMSTVAGSFGYMAPEYAQTRRVNEKIDVYSFGVVLLELATGREANDGDEHRSLAEWAWRKHVQENKPIAGFLDAEVMEPCNVEEMSCVFKVGIMCTATLPSKRPSMKEVLQILQRCSRQVAYGGKLAGIFDYAGAPLLKNSKRERDHLEEDDDDDNDDDDEATFAKIV